MTRRAVPLGVRLAACVALALACATTPAGAETAAGEAHILAERILGRESDTLLFDDERRHALARETARVLERIRDRHPVLSAVPARRERRPARLLLGLEPGLFDAVAGPRGGGIVTGHGAFDALGAKLGVTGIRLFPSLRIAELETGPLVNIDAAIEAGLAVDGVTFAEPDAIPGDGSDIEAVELGGLWHVVFRKAWGDCPSGCMNAELFFFAVDGTAVTRLGRREARAIAAFRALLARRGWD